MQQCRHRKWAASTVVLASVTAAAVLGTAVPASASTWTPSTSSVSTRTTGPSDAGTSGGMATTARTVSAQAAGRSQVGGETQSWVSIIRNAVNALKKVPALWKKLVDGVKKSYAVFRATVWPVIKTVVNVVSAAITAWDIWKYFN